MGQITTRKANGPPSLQTPALYDLVRTFTSRMETSPGGNFLISSLCVPSPEQRGVLEARRNDLVDALTPRRADLEEAADIILEMFYCWDAGRRMEAAKAAKTAAKYAEQVQDLPLWSVRKAADYWSKADSAFPPSAGELRTQALLATQPARQEAGEINRVLNAEVYKQNSEEERTRMLNGIARLKADIGGTNVVTKPLRAADYRLTPDQEAARQIEEFEARRHGPIEYGPAPIVPSPALTAVLKRGR